METTKTTVQDELFTAVQLASERLRRRWIFVQRWDVPSLYVDDSGASHPVLLRRRIQWFDKHVTDYFYTSDGEVYQNKVTSDAEGQTVIVTLLVDLPRLDDEIAGLLLEQISHA